MSETIHVARFRRKALTRGKSSTKKADSFIDTTGPASPPEIFEVLVTEGGARTVDGLEQTITANRTTGETVNIGDIVKYVNLMITVAPRLDNVQSIGTLEWAFVCHREIDPDPPITNVGTEMLGVICTRMYKEDCVYTGCMPVGMKQTACQAIQLKIPPKHCKIVQGDQWHLYMYFRTASSTETGTTNVKLVCSFNYKSYV